MAEAIPGFSAGLYGITAGPVFTLVFAFTVLGIGGISGKINRVCFIAVANIMFSGTSIGTAWVQKFWQVCTLRMMLGFF